MSIRSELFPDEKVWTEELDWLLEELPADLLESWSVYERRPDNSPHDRPIGDRDHYTQTYHATHPVDTVQLRYSPESITRTHWIEHTNALMVRHGSGYERVLDLDSDGDRQKSQGEPIWKTTGDEPKYIIDGIFVEPVVTRSTDRILEHLEASMRRTARATEVNAEIEHLAYPYRAVSTADEGDTSEPPDDPDEYFRQNMPVGFVEGVKMESIERLSKNFGTYYNVTVSDVGEISDCLSSRYRPDPAAVIDEIDRVLDRYNRFRQRDDWGGVNHDPASWTEYPAE